MGRLDDAIREAHRAMELDPLSAIAGASLAIRYWYAGRIDEAIAGFDEDARGQSGVWRRTLGPGAMLSSARRHRPRAR